MDQTSPAIEQWRQLLQQLKGGNRPRTNPQLMDRYANVLAEALTDTASIADQFVRDLHLLPIGVVGRAFGATYSRLTPEKRSAISSWISNERERGDSERAHSLRGLIRASPTDAFSALYEMRSPPAKDQKERIAAALSPVTAAQIAAMFRDQKEYEIRRVVLLLLLAAQEARADRSKAAVLEGILPTVARRSLHKDAIGVDVRNHILEMLRTLDQPTVTRMRESLSEKAPDVFAELMGALSSAPRPESYPPGSASETPETAPAEPAPAVDVVAERTEMPSTVEGTETAQKAAEPPVRVVADPLAWFDANIQMLAHAREFYVAARTDADTERKRREALELRLSELMPLAARLSAAESRISDLEAERAESTQEIKSLTAALNADRQELEAERQARASIERESVDTKDAFAKERDALQRRIDVNSEARVQDFRLAISSALAPIVRDVPPPGSQNAAELGPGLLICIDQIIRALTEKGITLRRGVGEHA